MILSDPQEVVKILKIKKFILNGREIIAKPYLSGNKLKAFKKEIYLRRLYIKGIPRTWTDAFLEEKLGALGRIEQAYSVKDDSGSSRGFGYAVFEDVETARKVVEQRIAVFDTVELFFQYTKRAAEKISLPRAGSRKGSGHSGSQGGGGSQRNQQLTTKLGSEKKNEAKERKEVSLQKEGRQGSEDDLDENEFFSMIPQLPKKRSSEKKLSQNNRKRVEGQESRFSKIELFRERSSIENQQETDLIQGESQQNRELIFDDYKDQPISILESSRNRAPQNVNLPGLTSQNNRRVVNPLNQSITNNNINNDNHLIVGREARRGSQPLPLPPTGFPERTRGRELPNNNADNQIENSDGNNSLPPAWFSTSKDHSKLVLVLSYSSRIKDNHFLKNLRFNIKPETQLIFFGFSHRKDQSRFNKKYSL